MPKKPDKKSKKPIDEDPNNFRQIILIGKRGCGFCEATEKIMKKMGVRKRFRILYTGKERDKLKDKYDIHEYPTIIDLETGKKNSGGLGKGGIKKMINTFSVKKRWHKKKKS